jgi:hypothetical protein
MSNEKQFDCVRFMRQARDRISREIAGMTPDEELRWFAEQRAKLDREAPLPSRDEPRRSA